MGNEQHDQRRHDDGTITRIFQAIDALAKRVDSGMERIDEVSRKLIDHMHYEDERYMHIEKGIEEIRNWMHGVIDSMPRDETGKPSLFVHRQDHEMAREYKSTAKEDRRKLRDKLIDYGIIGIIILIITHGEQILKLLTH